jgi:SAM-dependent methyltransferase
MRTVAQHDEFLNPLYSSMTLDLVGIRRSILQALVRELPRFRGFVLDIGSGYAPYRQLVLTEPSLATRYVGMDLKDNVYQKPDLQWDGRVIPLANESIDCALATEVFEHLPDPEQIMRESLRVLKPGGLLFLTVPFLWPLHTAPHDEYRYTPFALERHLRNAGFTDIRLRAHGGWDASLAQMVALWVRRRPMSDRRRALLSRLALPIVRYLASRDRPPQRFEDDVMLTGLSGTAVKPPRAVQEQTP